MGERQRPRWLVFIYILIMAVGFSNGYWIIPWYLKYICQISIIILAIAWLLVSADFKRLDMLGDYFLMYIIPFVGMMIISLTVWLWDFQAFNYITRGFSTVLYHIIALFFICAAVYLFGGRSIEYTLYAMILANIGIVCYSIGTYGIQEFYTGLVLFIKSAGIETNPAIKTLEVHDLTFAFGLYMMYYLLFEKGKRKRVLTLISVIFFFLGYKRVALFGFLGTLAVHLLLRKKKEDTQILIFQVLSWCGIGFCFAYVFIIRSELFDMIVNYFQLDTMGRQELYEYFRPIYDFHPLFRGYGIGYVTRYISILTEQGAGLFGTHGFGGMHNDIVTLYIELGFAGFALWIWYELRYRILWIIKKFGIENAKPLLYGTVYTFITYATDNTVFYCYINTIFMLLPLAYMVKWHEMRMERVSGENGKQEGEK